MLFYMAKLALMLEAMQLIAVELFRRCLRPRHRAIVAGGDLLMVASIPLVGVFGFNKNVFYALLFVLPLLSAGNPAQLARRYVLGLVLFPGLTEAYVVGGLYFGITSAFLFYNAGALLALALTARGRLRPVRAIDAAVWALFLVEVIASSRGEEINGTLRTVATTLLLVIPPYFIIARAIGSPATAEDTVSFFVLGGVCNSIVGVFESVRHWAIYESIYPLLKMNVVGLSANASMRAGLLRAGGAIDNYETFGLLTAMAALAAIAIRHRFTRGGFYTIMSLLLAGLIVSQARSAWLGLLVGLVLRAIFERQWRRLGILVGGMMVIAAPAFLLASNDGKLGQLLGKGGAGASTVDYRQRLLDRGLDEAARNPWTGHTIDTLSVSLNDMRQGDHIIDFVNTHLYVMLVGGIGLLIVWAGAWGTPMWLGWRRQRRRVERATLSASLPFALIGTIFVYLTFTSAIDRILSLAAIAMGLMSVCFGLARRRPAAPAADAGVRRGSSYPPLGRPTAIA